MYENMTEQQVRHADRYTSTFNRRDRRRLLQSRTIRYDTKPQIMEIKPSGKWGPKLEVHV